MARPTLPADGVKPWGSILRDAINDVSDRADQAITYGNTANSAVSTLQGTVSTLSSTSSSQGSTITALQGTVASKADDSNTVHKTGAETISGVKTFNSAPVVPDNSFATTKVTGLDTALSGKASTSHTHTSANVTDLVEFIQDTVAAFVIAGTNMTITYNDASNTLTLSSATSGGGGSLSQYQVVYRWNPSTSSYPELNVTDDWGRLILSTNDVNAPPPSDANLKIGDRWAPHPQSPHLAITANGEFGDGF